MNAIVWWSNGRERDGLRHDISRGRSGSRGVERWWQHDARGRRGDRLDGLVQVDGRDGNVQRPCAERGAVLVHAVIGAAAVTGVLHGLAVVMIEDGAAVLVCDGRGV
ncbi:MAG: hypothetical protein U0974_09320 [Gemmatimonadales bacterium]|nr:hypothetical protein [Gemmatimonadales bacterium]MDZ4389917.1 hypothetical protein [Gemmatimonadales bacterium]